MKRIVYLFSSLLFIACSHLQEVDYVNPLIGTDYTGNTYPGVTAPFGMVQLSPDNGLPGWDRIAGYYYPDSTIAGFSHTHLQGTGAGDLYDISFFPVMNPYLQAEAPLGIYSHFSHSDEVAEVGYYSVLLKDYGIKVELTATERMGIQRYTFPQGSASIFLNLSKAMNWDATVATDIHLVDSTTIVGYRYSKGWARDQRLFFATHFSTPFTSFSIDTIPLPESDNVGLIARFDYSTTAQEQILLCTALSPTSEDAALRLLRSSYHSFDEYVALSKSAWNKELSTVKVSGGTPDEKSIFYTALYHAFSCPTLFCDADSTYFGSDKQIHHGRFVNYTTFSLWDTYRAAHPLYTILQPHRVNDMVASMVAQYDEFGRLPVWSLYGSETDMMIGYHSAAVIAEAYLKGIRLFDASHALQASINTASLNHYRGIGHFHQLGYVPYDIVDLYNSDDWSLSRTLEYAYDDYCIAVFASALGQQQLSDTWKQFALFYHNLWSPYHRFFVPRDSLGRFQPSFSATDYTPHICESNAWQYLWSVQHDIEGLKVLLGGETAMALRLDSMFSYNPSLDAELPIFSTGMIGQYAHGNEPSHHVSYLYNAVHQPWKTAQLVTRIMRDLYRNSPDGLCGNEDCGQTSAWYVFSAIGFYPVSPISCQYELGMPLFDEVSIPQANGNPFTIHVYGRKQGAQNYIKEVRLNGAPYHQSYITHQQILDGSRLDLYLTTEEGICWY